VSQKRVVAKLDVRKILFLTKAVLVLALCYVCICLFFLPGHLKSNLEPAAALGKTGIQPGTSPVFVSLSETDYAEIASRNPFAGLQRTAGPKSAEQADCDLSASEQLGLVLLGTISAKPQLARAVIKNTQTDAVGLFKIGQTVGDGRLERIEDDHVIVSHEGGTEVLRLGPLAEVGGCDAGRVSLSKGGSARTKQRRKPVQTSAVQRGSAERAGNIEALFKRAVIEPYVVDGETEGLRITDLKSMKVAEKLGLRDGDVISKLNGQKLTSKQKAYQILVKARSQPVIKIELLRRGETKELSFVLH